jgi:hypothetical protein
MDPDATPAEPMPALPGFPFLHAGAGAVIVGPTGAGRSSLVQAGLYDAARASMHSLYLGGEVTRAEFNARAAALAAVRGDEVDDSLRAELGRVRYLDLSDAISFAWAEPQEWTAGITVAYQILAIDPVSAVASALMLDFDKSNDDWVRFYDKLIRPLTAGGVTVLLLDNVGHAEEAKRRAKGASAKSDRADLTFSCALCAEPVGLLIKAHKVRSVRAGFQRGDEWLFAKDTHRILVRGRGEDHGSTFRPTGQMQRVSEAVEQEPGLSKRAIRATVGGKAATVDLALELLISEGNIAANQDGQATRHRSIKPYREPTVSTVSQPCPAPCPDTPPTDRVPVSAPLRAGHGHGHGDGQGQQHTPESLIATRSAGTITEAEFDRAYDELAATA